MRQIALYDESGSAYFHPRLGRVMISMKSLRHPVISEVVMSWGCDQLQKPTQVENERAGQARSWLQQQPVITSHSFHILRFLTLSYIILCCLTLSCVILGLILCCLTLSSAILCYLMFNLRLSYVILGYLTLSYVILLFHAILGYLM